MAFVFFSKLPPEMRCAIWDWYLYNETLKRIVPVTDCYRVQPMKNLVSPLLTTNRESRARAKNLYTLSLDVIRPTATITRVGASIRGTCPFGEKFYSVLPIEMLDADAAIDAPENPRVGKLHVSPSRDIFTLGLEPFLGNAILSVPGLPKWGVGPWLSNTPDGSPESACRTSRLTHAECDSVMRRLAIGLNGKASWWDERQDPMKLRTIEEVQDWTRLKRCMFLQCREAWLCDHWTLWYRFYLVTSLKAGAPEQFFDGLKYNFGPRTLPRRTAQAGLCALLGRQSPLDPSKVPLQDDDTERYRQNHVRLPGI
ncbi:hypothetical protein F4778DRAFT_788125 [Xylariomycetidae sp. FL2044]|nr:hypothetical protein F4778DRAFT_788125 [Xylariomycetidae sp. FL2044]